MQELCYFNVGTNEGGIRVSLSKGGYLFLFIGIILLALSIFFTTDWGFAAWATLFLVSLVLCTVGIIILIVNLVKQINADKRNRM